MFTGIIEKTGIIRKIDIIGTNYQFWIESELSPELKIDQSVSHDGVCLTIDELKTGMHRVTAIDETITKTNLGTWKVGQLVNLERCMLMNGRIDGHIVQGHVDTTGICTSIKDKKGSWEYTIEIDASFGNLIIEKGSISMNGTSLTIYNVTHNSFDVAIIPYTFENTNINQIKMGDRLNIEFDMIGKYVNRIAQLKQ